MTSVINKIADLALSPEKQEAYDRLSAAEKVLGSDPAPSEAAARAARLDKLVALVDLDLYSGVVAFADAKSFQEELVFFAYALYRTGSLEALRKILNVNGFESAPIGAKLALIQAEYKFGHPETARKLLEKCKTEISSEDEGDVAVNLSAIDALQGLVNNVDAGFDGKFNSGYALLVRGRAAEALSLLQEAAGLAEEEDDRQAAIAQAAYAHLLLGNKEEALNLLSNIASQQLSEPVRLVVANNKLAAEFEGGDLLTAHRALLTFDEFSKRSAALSVNSNQRQVLLRNQLKLLARVGISSSLRKAKRHQAEFPQDYEPLAVAYRFSKSLKKLRKEAENGDLPARIALAAIEGREWRNEQSQSELELSNFDLLAHAVALAKSGSDDVSDYFESLRIPELTDAGLSLLKHDNSSISDSLLASISSFTSDLNAAQLDQQVPQTAQASTSTLKTAPRKKRSGKRKLPADFDPERQPNPERWLAKQDRSDYKPKKKKNTQATQGAAGTSMPLEESSAAQQTSQVVGAKTKKKNNKKKGKK